MNQSLDNLTIAIIGLGYVGLPLAVEFGKKYRTLGFDINQARIDELASGQDHTLECSAEELKNAQHLSYTADIEALKQASVYIVTVPTPINKHNQPDLTPLIKSSTMLGGVIAAGDTVIYESTVYPGCTEEVCVPILEEVSGLVFNKDFFVGYSPERINPGDKEHKLTTIMKVTSGSNEATAQFVDNLYASIITAGTHKASSLKVAEAAKVIENTQRDINIALVNELSMIFQKLDINTNEVLKAAGTKWNFLPFRPGLVGGHCIGVDPYYLTHKAQEVGYHPEMILAGRRINDNMGQHIAKEIVKVANKKGILIKGAKALVMGLTFKENCPDLRNTKVVDVIEELQDHLIDVDVVDPWVDANLAQEEYPFVTITDEIKSGDYDFVILAVSHKQFADLSIEDIKKYAKPTHVIYDIKSIFDHNVVDGQL